MKKFNKHFTIAIIISMLLSSLPTGITAMEIEDEMTIESQIPKIEVEETEGNPVDEAEAVAAADDDSVPQNNEIENEDSMFSLLQMDKEYVSDTFGYTLKGDPYNDMKVNDSYYLRDENFFGKWDSKKNSWTITGKLNYNDYGELSNVENAAKAGDYEVAKLELYNYYLIKERNLDRTKDTSSTVSNKITADLLEKNFMYNGNSGITPLALMKVDNEPRYVSADVTATITKYLGTRQNLTFWVLSTDKNGDGATFTSKEGDSAEIPYLRIKVNGTEKIIYPSDDTYLSAGTNKTKKYGSEPILRAMEDNITDTANLVNENTARIYMKFDVTELNSGDTISAATLNMYGKNDIDGQSREVVVFYSDDSDWTEAALTYSSAIAQVIYSFDQLDTWPWNQPTSSGYRFPEELLRFNTWYDKLVKLYNQTGDEAYAYTALRQLMDFINVRGMTPSHIKTLDVAVRSQCLPGLTMQLIKSKYMTPDIFTGFLKYMWVEANAAKSFSTSGNWGTSETYGLSTIAMNYPEFTDSEAWMNRVKVRYETLSNGLMSPDLSCYELSLGYTDYTLDTFVGTKKVADTLKVTDYPYSDKTLEVIHGLAKYLYFAAMPGVKDAQTGDGYSHRGGFTSRLTFIGDWFNDDILKYGGSSGEDGVEPNFKSILFPYGKKAVMRTGWDDKALYFYTDVDGGTTGYLSTSSTDSTPNENGKYVAGNHAHPDDNSVVVMAYGQYLLVDPLYGTYSASASKTWLTSTIAHNTVTMNGKNQTYGKKAGTVDGFETNNFYDYVETNSPNTVDAEKYVRKTLFIKPNFFIVSDYLVPNNTSSNKYVQSWHFLPEADITMDEQTKVTRSNIPGVNIQVVPVGSEEFSRSAVVAGLYSEGQGSVSDADYTEYQKNQTGNTIFNTVLVPENIGDSIDVSSQTIDLTGIDSNSASAFQIMQVNNNTNNISFYDYYVLHDESKKTNVSFGGFSTDGSLALVEKNSMGAVKSLVARGATELSGGDSYLLKSDNAIDELSVEFSGEYCLINSSTLTKNDLISNNIKIGAGDNKIKSVKLNGEDTLFSLVDNTLYFAETPSTPSPDPSPTPMPTVKPSSGHGGGGGSGSGGGSTVVPPAATPTPTPTVNPEGNSKREMNDAMREELAGHWAEKEITSLYEDGIINGKSEDSLNLSDEITRAEFLAMLIRILKSEEIEYNGDFFDVAKDSWYANVVETAYVNKIAFGSDGYFYPENSITREEMATIIERTRNFGNVENELLFSDVDQISSWAYDSVAKMVNAKLMLGDEENKFLPKNKANRQEAFAVIYRYLSLE